MKNPMSKRCRKAKNEVVVLAAEYLFRLDRWTQAPSKDTLGAKQFAETKLRENALVAEQLGFYGRSGDQA